VSRSGGLAASHALRHVLKLRYCRKYFSNFSRSSRPMPFSNASPHAIVRSSRGLSASAVN
jgi:hypothetical protein